MSFESRNPVYREWERWTPEATYNERMTPVGLLREWLEVTDYDNGRVMFDAHNVFADGEVRVYTNVLYFRTAEELTRELRAADFTNIAMSGDWRGSSVDDSSPLIVCRAQKA